MNISPPQLLNPDVYVSGDVTIDPGATLAPGVILQAAADGQLRIAAGVCIGRGVIIQVYQGILEIETGVVLGSGVLILGPGTLGENACIGSETTILESSIAPQQVVAAGSLIGDRSRVLEPQQVSAPPESAPEPAIISPWFEEPAPVLDWVSPTSEWENTPTQNEIPAQPSAVSFIPAEAETVVPPNPEKSEETALVTQSPASSELSSAPLPPVIYGKEHLSHLLDTLLPHRKAFNNSQS